MLGPLCEQMLAGVAADGSVTVEGHYVGRLAGVQFEAAQGSSVLDALGLPRGTIRATSSSRSGDRVTDRQPRARWATGATYSTTSSMPC